MINSNSCAAAFSQMATIAALSGPQTCVEKMVEEFRGRRDLIVRELSRIDGIRCRMPKGAFYAFPNVSNVDTDVKRLSNFLLDEGGLACLPGTAFGEGGRGYLRLSYANSRENILEGLRRLEAALTRYSAAALV